MNKHSAITLPATEQRHLRDAALRYSLSPDYLARRILSEATQVLLAVPEESLDAYQNSEEITEALHDAFRSERKGELLHSLPKSIRRLRK